PSPRLGPARTAKRARAWRPRTRGVAPPTSWAVHPTRLLPGDRADAEAVDRTATVQGGPHAESPDLARDSLLRGPLAGLSGEGAAREPALGQPGTRASTTRNPLALGPRRDGLTWLPAARQPGTRNKSMSPGAAVRQQGRQQQRARA